MSHVVESMQEIQAYFAHRRSMTARSLATEAESYRRDAQETSERLDAYVRAHYGIANCTSLIDTYLGSDLIMLGRQIVSPSTEQLAFSVVAGDVARSLGWKAKVVSFIGDCYGNHRYKQSLVKIPVLNAGNRSIQYVPVVTDRRTWDDRPPLLHSIVTDAGEYWGEACDSMKLPEFHRWLWKRATGCKAKSADITRFWNQMLCACMETPCEGQPSSFFIEEDGGAVRLPSSAWERLSEEQRTTARPPAEWYYFFYLAFFVTGKRILFEAPDEDLKVQALFKMISEVQRVTGKTPLIVEIPNHVTISPGNTKLTFDEVNEAIVRNGIRPDLFAFAGNTIYERMLVTMMLLTQHT